MRPESSRAVNVRCTVPSGVFPFSFATKVTLLPVVDTGSELSLIFRSDTSGGVTVTLPLKPPVRLINTTSWPFVPRAAEIVEGLNPIAKSR